MKTKFIIFFIILLNITILANAKLNVETVTPIDETKYTSDYDVIVVTFNEEMVNVADLNKEYSNENYLSFNIEVDGVYKWITTKTLSFKPNEKFKTFMKIDVTVNKDNISSLAGDILSEDYEWSFYTKISPIREITTITISSYNPVDPLIYVSFEEPASEDDDFEYIKKFIRLDENGSSRDFIMRYITTNELDALPYSFRGYENLKTFNLKKVIVIEPTAKFNQGSLINVTINDYIPKWSNLDAGNGVGYNKTIKIHDKFTFTGKNSLLDKYPKIYHGRRNYNLATISFSTPISTATLR